MALKIMLVNPPTIFVEEEGDRPPLGILYLAAVLEKNGYRELRIVDLALKPSPGLEKELKEFRPDVVGVTITTPLFFKAVEIADTVKRVLPDAVTVAGGPHPSSMPDQTLQESNFDIVVRGEGENTFLELARALESGGDKASVKGISFKDGTNITHTANREFIQDLDSIPLPSRHLVPMKDYYMKINGVQATTLITSRGCPFDCVYCTKTIFGRVLRARKPEEVVAEIEHVIGSYGIRGFLFVDDTFTIDPQRVERICNIIIERKLEITWRCWTRSNTVTKPLLQKMKDAGCAIVCFGVESGDQGVLDKARKCTRVEDNLNAIRMSKEVGLFTKAFIMVGLPGETERTVENTIEFLKKAQPDTVDFYITTPFPNTYLWNHAEELGIKILSRDWKNYFQVGKRGEASEAVIETDGLSREDIMRMHKKLRDSFIKSKGG